MNPPRTIGSIIPQITSLKSGTGIGFGLNGGDGILPKNIRSFSLFDIGTSDFSDRSALLHGAEKVKTLEATEF